MLPQLTPEELIENFQVFDDWEQRYAYLIDLGKQLPAFPEESRNEAHRVRGCVSNVWIVAEQDEQKRLVFLGDSDAFIVKGLIAVVFILCSAKAPADILHLDIPKIFNELNLAQHLTPSRSNGLYSMINYVRRLAQACEL
ncbi:MAG: SufE family protein [Gammaproteobacteria bacterium]